MRRPLPLLLTLALVGVAAALASGGPAILFDAPHGARLATLDDAETVTVLERRDGWARIRLEGWVQEGQTPLGNSPSPAPSAPVSGAAAPAAAAAPASGSASIQGVLAPPLGAGGGPGAGVLVLLVRDGDDLDRAHRTAGEECRARLEAKDRDVETLRGEVNRALNSATNFREASTKSDQAKSKLAAAEKERAALVQDCRARAQQTFETAVASRAISDGSGRFDFQDLDPGRYRVVAFETTGAQPRTWSFSVTLAASGRRVLDPAADRSAVPADWGVR